MKKILLTLIFLFQINAFSQEVKILSVDLEYGKAGKTYSKYQKADDIKIDKNGKLTYSYRFKVIVKNLSSKAIEAVVFRYAIYLNLRNINTDERISYIPYAADDIRTSKIPANREKAIYIYNLDLQEQLRRIKNSNFEINSIRLDIAKEPKKEDFKIEISSYTFDIKVIK